MEFADHMEWKRHEQTGDVDKTVGRGRVWGGEQEQEKKWGRDFGKLGEANGEKYLKSVMKKAVDEKP